MFLSTGISDAPIYQGAKCALNPDMDINEIRRANLRLLLARYPTIRAFAEAADTDPAYVSQILSDKTKRSLGNELARKIENNLGLNHGWMDSIKLAEPERLSDAILADLDAALPVRAIPIVGQTTGGGGGYWEELGFPVGHGEAVVDMPSKDKNAYALRVKGSSMSPRMYEGEAVVVEPNHPCVPGDEVVVRVHNGETMVKVLLSQRNGETILGSVGTDDRIELQTKDIEFMHFVVGVARRSAIRMPD